MAPDESRSVPPQVGPLHGIRVLDLTRVLAGPHATRMLADLGAEVIKLEPPEGDLTRFTAPRVGGVPSYYAQQNTGKRAISIDIRRPGGSDLVHRLADQCDVFVENFRPGVLDAKGIGYAALSATNPRLVYAAITGYGSDGPWVRRRAYAPVIGAETGFTRAQGDARRGIDDTHRYANDVQSHADAYSGAECCTAVLAALFQRERTGRGQRVEVSLAETMLYINEHVHDHLWDGEVQADWVRSFGTGDYPVFTTADGVQSVVSGHPAENGSFDRYCLGLGCEHLVADPRFATRGDRVANFDELMGELHTAAAQIPTAEALEAQLAEHAMAAGRLRTVREIAGSKWAAARGAIVSVPDRSGGTIRIPNAPWRFSDASAGVRGEPRFRGEDNRAVLTELLGLDDGEVDRLEADGVLSANMPR